MHSSNDGLQTPLRKGTCRHESCRSETAYPVSNSFANPCRGPKTLLWNYAGSLSGALVSCGGRRRSLTIYLGKRVGSRLRQIVTKTRDW